MYVTYGIICPKSFQIVYVGQTKNFQRRKDQHLMAHRERGRPKPGSLQAWLRRINRQKLTPAIIILEEVETEGESLASELDWVRRLGEAGVPLLNRWEEHKAFITDAPAEKMKPLVPLIFVEKKGTRVGSIKLNRNKTGYTLKLSKGVTLDASTPIELLPPKDGDKQ